LAFFLTSFATLAVIFLGIGGWIGLALSIALAMPFTAQDHRPNFECIMWIARAGAQRRHLPDEHGK
jgi:hypothetical protein